MSLTPDDAEPALTYSVQQKGHRVIATLKVGSAPQRTPSAPRRTPIAIHKTPSAPEERPSLATLLAEAEKAAEARRAAARERTRAFRERRSDPELVAQRARDRERKRLLRESLTPEQLEAWRKRERERRRAITDEELEESRAARCEWERRRHEARMRELERYEKAIKRSRAKEKAPSDSSADDEEAGEVCVACRQSAERNSVRTVSYYVCLENDIREPEDVGGTDNAQHTCIKGRLRKTTLRRSRRHYSICVGEDDPLPEHADQSSQTEHHLTLVWCPRPKIEMCSTEVQVDLL